MRGTVLLSSVSCLMDVFCPAPRLAYVWVIRRKPSSSLYHNAAAGFSVFFFLCCVFLGRGIRKDKINVKYPRSIHICLYTIYSSRRNRLFFYFDPETTQGPLFM